MYDHDYLWPQCKQFCFAFVCRYVVTLGAPTSIAQRTEDDTLTYLNKGKTLSCKNQGTICTQDFHYI